MSEIDAVLYEYVKSIHVIYADFFCFQASTALCIFMSTHANSWIKVAARQNTIWIRFGNRRAVRRRRAEAGMALTAIGEFTQWGGAADCIGSRTIIKYIHGNNHGNNSLLKRLRRYDFLVRGLLRAEREPLQIRKDYDIYRYLSVSEHKIYFLLMHAQKPSILDIPVGSLWTLFTQAVLRSRNYFFRLRLLRAANPNFGSSSGSGSSPGSR